MHLRFSLAGFSADTVAATDPEVYLRIADRQAAGFAQIFERFYGRAPADAARIKDISADGGAWYGARLAARAYQALLLMIRRTRSGGIAAGKQTWMRHAAAMDDYFAYKLHPSVPVDADTCALYRAYSAFQQALWPHPRWDLPRCEWPKARDTSTRAW